MLNRRLYQAGRCTIEEEGEESPFQNSRIVINKRMSSSSSTTTTSNNHHVQQRTPSSSSPLWWWWTNVIRAKQSHHSFFNNDLQIITKSHNKKTTILRKWVVLVVVIIILLLIIWFGSSTSLFFFNNDGEKNGNSSSYLLGGNYAKQRRLLLAKQEKSILIDWKLLQQQQQEQPNNILKKKASSSSWMQSSSSSAIGINNNDNSNDVQQQEQQDDHHHDYEDDDQTILHRICSNRKVVNLTTDHNFHDNDNNNSNQQQQQKQQQSSWTIVMTVNDGYFDFFQNWYRHYEKLQLNLHLVLFAEDSKAYFKLLSAKEEEKDGFLFPSSSHITVVYTGLEKIILAGGSKEEEEEENESNNNIRRREVGEVVGTEAFDANSPQYNRLISMRPSRLLSVLCTGRDVLYVDADTVWRSNPLIYLEDVDETHDKAHKAKAATTIDTTTTTGFVDGYMAVDVRKIPKKFAAHGVEFCTGFAALKATRKTLEFVSQWELSCQSTEGGYNDQQIFNKVYHHLLKEKKEEEASNNNTNGRDGGIARMKGLPKAYFPNGDEYFNRFSDNDRKQVVQVHANFMIGKETKKKKLQEYGLWIV